VNIIFFACILQLAMLKKASLYVNIYHMDASKLIKLGLQQIVKEKKEKLTALHNKKQSFRRFLSKSAKSEEVLESGKEIKKLDNLIDSL